MSKRTKLPLWQGAELSTYFDIQCRRRELKQHKKRLRHMKSEVNDKPPKKLPHLSSSASKQTFTDFEYRRMDMENEKLFGRLKDLSKSKSRYPTYDNSVKNKNASRTVRKREREKIARENEYIARRIRSVAPTYHKKEWEKHNSNHIRKMNERMKRHAIRLHGPKFVRKLEERKYLGKHRSYSDIGSECSFTCSTSEFSTSEICSSARTEATDISISSQATSSSIRSKSSSRSVSTTASNSRRRRESRSSVLSKNIRSRSRLLKEEKTSLIEAKKNTEESLFSYETLDKVVNPDIPSEQFLPKEVAKKPTFKTKNNLNKLKQESEDSVLIFHKCCVYNVFFFRIGRMIASGKNES